MKKILAAFALATALISSAAAVEFGNWEFSATVDFAYYPKSNYGMELLNQVMIM